MASSLGYAPALIELSAHYASEKGDLLLSLVYLNLVISYGHNEYRDYYYNRTKLLAKWVGIKVIKEIENIALKKTVKISQMQEKMNYLKNTFKPAIKLIGMGVTFDDSFLTKEHWKPFFDSEDSWKQFFEIFK